MAEEPSEALEQPDSEAIESVPSSEDEGALVEQLKGAPPQVRKVMETMMATMVSAEPRAHPIFDMLNEKHVDKFLDYGHEDDQRQHELERSARWFNLFYYMSALAVILFLVWFLLPSNKDLLLDLIKVIVAFAGGFGAGYGFSKRQ